jgi:hypothetical protein
MKPHPHSKGEKMDANLFALVVKLLVLNSIANAVALVGMFTICYCCNKIDQLVKSTTIFTM